MRGPHCKCQKRCLHALFPTHEFIYTSTSFPNSSLQVEASVYHQSQCENLFFEAATSYFRDTVHVSHTSFALWFPFFFLLFLTERNTVLSIHQVIQTVRGFVSGILGKAESGSLSDTKCLNLFCETGFFVWNNLGSILNII